MVRPNQEMARVFEKGEILSVEFGDQLMQYLISGLADEGGGENCSAYSMNLCDSWIDVSDLCVTLFHGLTQRNR